MAERFHRLRRRSGVIQLGVMTGFLALSLLVGCGGGKSFNPSPTGGTGTTSAGGSTSGGGITAGGTTEEGTARFHVDVTSREVTVTPLSGANQTPGRAVFTGTSVAFSSSPLLDQPGNNGLKAVNVAIYNQWGVPIGLMPDGRVTGLKVLFGPFTNASNFTSDLRSQTATAAVAGAGGVGGQDGPVGSASFNNPSGIAVDRSGTIYVADARNNKIRKISGGIVSTLAGSGAAAETDGAGTGASFNMPFGIAISPQDQSLVVTDFGGNRIRRVAQDGTVTTLAGTGSAGSGDGAGSLATFFQPAGVAINQSGLVYVAEYGSNKIRLVVPPFVYYNNSNSTTTLVNTLAGSGAAGASDGVGPAASFNGPTGIAVEPFSGTAFVADSRNNLIRLVTPGGTVATIGGTGSPGSMDGPGSTATFNVPYGVALVNGSLVVSDSGGETLRQMTPNNGGSSSANTSYPPNNYPASAAAWRVATVAGSAGMAGTVDGAGTAAQFNTPTLLTSDGNGNVYVADTGNNKVRRLTPTNGFFPLGFATGSAPGEPVQLSNADGVIPNSTAGANLPYLDYALPQSSYFGGTTTGGGTTGTTTATGGTTTGATTGSTGGSTVGTTSSGFFRSRQYGYSYGNYLGTRTWAFFIPSGVTAFEFTVTVEANTSIAAPPEAGQGAGSPTVDVRTLAGGQAAGFRDDIASKARFSGPQGVAVDLAGDVYIADSANNAIRRVSAQVYPPPTASGSSSPMVGGLVSTVAGAVGAGGGTAVDGPGNTARFNDPTGVAVSADGRTIYAADSMNNQVRRIALTGSDPTNSASWTVTTIAGTGTAGAQDGPGNGATLNGPYGIVIDPGGAIYVTESTGNRVRQLQFKGGDASMAPNWQVSLVAGDNSAAAGASGGMDGVGAAARFNQPAHIATDRAGNLYVADTLNNRIRKITPDGAVTTLAGSTSGDADGAGSQAMFNSPSGIVVDTGGDVYVGDTLNQQVRRVSPTGTVMTVAGSGQGSTDGPGNAASFNAPSGMAMDAAGNLYVADRNNNTIRLVQRIISVGTQ